MAFESRHMIRAKTLVAIGVIATFGALCAVQLASAGNPNYTKVFQQLLSIAERLESAEMFFVEKTESVQKERQTLLRQFARMAKNIPAQQHFEAMSKISDEFRVRANQFLDENKKGNKNWFGFIKLGGPLGGLKNLAKADPFLTEVVQRYEGQVKGNLLEPVDIDCDVVKFSMKTLNSILFVMQTDIKCLLTDDQQLLNQAIYEELKQNKFVSRSNFYDIQDLNANQKELLLGYFADRVDHSQVNVGQALEHFDSPSEYILGRVIDSCQGVLQLSSEMRDLQISFDDACSKSTADPKQRLFLAQWSFDKFQDTFTFCQNFLNAL